MEHLDNLYNGISSWLFFGRRRTFVMFIDLLIPLVLVVLFLTEDIDESVYIFSPDTYPHQRQQLYQLCDLQDDTLQAIIHSNDGKETKCHVSIH